MYGNHEAAGVLLAAGAVLAGWIGLPAVFGGSQQMSFPGQPAEQVWYEPAKPFPAQAASSAGQFRKAVLAWAIYLGFSIIPIAVYAGIVR